MTPSAGMVAIASNTSLEDATRHLALEFLLTVAENMTNAAKKLDRFCETTVPVALSMMLEIDMNTAEELAEWEEREEDDEDEEITNYDVGEEAIDRLAIALGGRGGFELAGIGMNLTSGVAMDLTATP